LALPADRGLENRDFGGTGRKGLNMVSSGRKKGTTRFSLEAGTTATRVFLAGVFSNWQPQRMRRQKDGTFVLILPLGAGEYEYKFVVDDEWVTDPDNLLHAPNPYGTLNSVAAVA